jgi:hypothetical protein
VDDAYHSELGHVYMLLRPSQRTPLGLSDLLIDRIFVEEPSSLHP